MKKVMFLFVFVFLFLTFLEGFCFSVRTNPPPSLGKLKCDCSAVTSCTCTLGGIQVGVVLDESEFSRMYDIGPLGPTCSSGCIGALGEVVTVSLPFFKVENIEQAEKKASMTIRKSMSLSEKIVNSIKAMFSGVGGGTESDSLLQMVKEKSIQAAKGETEKATVDLTTYFVLTLTKDIFITQQPSAIQVANVIENLNDMANKGELVNFLGFYFYMRQKHPEFIYSSSSNMKAPVNILGLYNVMKGGNETERMKGIANLLSFLILRSPEQKITEDMYVFFRKIFPVFGREPLEEIRQEFVKFLPNYKTFFGVDFENFEKLPESKKGADGVYEQMKTAQGQFWPTTEKELLKSLSEIKQIQVKVSPETGKGKKIFIFILVLALMAVVVIFFKKLGLKIRVERKQDKNV